MCSLIGFSQSSIKQLQQTARDYNNRGDHANAVIVLRQGLRDFPKALELEKQLAGNVFKALEEVKECEQLYQKGIKKFPASGPLYSEWGELRSSNKDGRAITCWEDGIQADPSYGGNYYNAALHYSKINEPIWALLYAEIYINMESRSDRARNMKKILFEQYQQLLTKQAYQPGKKSGAFTQQVFQILDNASGPATYTRLREFLFNRVFKIPTGQYYRNR